jgi:putative cell wall-binding protein
VIPARTIRLRALLLLPLAGLLAVPPGAAAQGEPAPVRVSDNQPVVVDDAEGDPVRGLDIPGLAADPGDPDHVVLVAEELLRGECVYRVTFDGAGTWEGDDLRAPEGFPDSPCTGFDSGGYTHSDGSVAFGSDQNVYTTFSSVREGEGDSILVARSTDGGRTFETATVAIPGGVETSAEGDIGPVHQRPKLAVEARPEGDRVYVAAWGGAYLDLEEDEEVPGCGGPCGYRVVTAVSDDGGLTWAEPVDATAPRTPEELVATAPLDIAREQSQPAVTPDGETFIAWRARFDTETGEDRLMVGSSSDGGATWERTVVGGEDELITGLRHPKMAAGPDGTLYVTYQADSSAAEDADSDIFLRRSSDGGTSWSEPLRVNDDAAEGGDGADQSIPQIKAAPDGRVDLVWHDRRHAYPGPAEFNDIYYAFSDDQGQSVSANQRVTDRTINLDVGLDARVGTTSFYHPAVTAIEDGSAMVAWADPRQGNFLDGSQDIYFATLELDAEGAPPVEEVEALTATGDVALSQYTYPGGNQRVDGDPATKVVIVAEGDVAAALAAAPLARANYGPVLVSPASGLPDVVKDEIVRLDPSGAFVVGSADSLSEDVVRDLVDAGLSEDSVVRLEGADDAVAAALARALADTPRLSDGDLEDLQEEGTPPPAIEEVVIVDPEDPAAAPAAALAAARRLPVLFATGGEIPPVTAEVLASLPVERALVVGGPSSISEEAMMALPSPTRLGGDDLAATSAAVAGEAADRGLPTNVVYLAGGDQPMEGAVMAASVARLGGLLLVQDAGGAGGAAGALDGVDAAAGADRIVVLATTAPGRNWLPVALAVAFVVAGALFAGVALRRARSSS